MDSQGIPELEVITGSEICGTGYRSADQAMVHGAKISLTLTGTGLGHKLTY